MKPSISKEELNRIISQLTEWDTIFQQRKLSREQEVFWEVSHSLWSFAEMLRQKIKK